MWQIPTAAAAAMAISRSPVRLAGTPQPGNDPGEGNTQEEKPELFAELKTAYEKWDEHSGALAVRRLNVRSGR